MFNSRRKTVEDKEVMKIGILTFHSQLNYGGVLQCWALQTVLAKQIQDYVYVGLNDGLTIRQTKSNENKIQNISVDSDMNLNIEIGLNKFRIARDVGEFSAKIKYRQKYIGV